MALEQSENTTAPAAIHTSSSVAEAIALLSGYASSDRQSYTQHEHELLQQSLSAEAVAFLEDWRMRSRWDFIYLYELFIPFPYFNDITLFLKGISSLSDESYLYYLFGGELTRGQISQALLHPGASADFGQNATSMFGDKPEFMQAMFAEIQSIRISIDRVLREIASLEVLQEQLQTKQSFSDAAIQTSQAFGLEPLPLAQKLMGKTFRRVSDYQAFYFIPSYYLTVARIRVFDDNTCIVVYNCHNPRLNVLEQSQELEKQLKAISDRNRLQILRMLRQRKEYGARLANALDLTTATISHHLEILKQAGLIREEKVGNIKYFELDQAKFSKLLQDMGEFIQLEEN
ncbi:helix-turn-helix transcriptional regulator [Paenibacillus sp. NFR01]|uniref:ArsR/SmtB family transcription factor n=1 Tax=Paenibacillus sp. NFR01 TaxID=1566279 RepID=UPI0008D217B7|nr:metalloregulator ArsR/SmtB family transcription factor [Paenibacillus sp. NFR01]SET06203.1 DNA-binding transcriptional regulator, ArsR family [Paenibacillus sp. NFR01]